jgi:hypothetical protein
VVGKGAAISALGTSFSRGPTTVHSAGVCNILRGMESVGVERFIGVSASGFVDDPDDTLLMRNVAKQILKSVLRHPYADMVLMEEEMKRGGSEWTIVRPPGSPTAHTGRYRTTINGNVPGSWSVSRADVADFVVTHLRDPS